MKYFKKPLVVSMVLLSLSFAACNKDNAVQQETKEKAQIASNNNNQKLRRFISIIWNVELVEVKYDEKEKNFAFQNFKMTLKDAENLYEISNEYKLKYE